MNGSRTARCDRPQFRTRKLRLEILEERRVLSAGGVVEATALVGTAELPWHNSVHRYDVNNDGVTNTTDVLAIVNRILQFGTGELPVPPENPVALYYDTNGDNRLTVSDLHAVINTLLQPPQVEVTTLTTFTVDVTPQVTVRATPQGAAGLPDGTIVYLDVDLNNDGDFSDPGEMGHTQSTLYQGQSVFTLSTALQRSSEIYSIRLQARVQNTEAVFGRSAPLPLVVDTLTSDALAQYVYTPDPSYQYSIRATTQHTIPFIGSYSHHAIDMTSQTWRSAADVNLPVWRHWVSMYVPAGTVTNTAILLIDGGNNNNFATPPEQVAMLGQAAVTLGVVFVHLKVVPNEPVIFTDETRSRTEDAIIAYSFDKFLENIGQPGNDTWPVLVAMVKSAARAMDTAQTVLPTVKAGASISDFVVTGYSKRGWTTWLTAAVDPRVRAILPGVFDNLNQGPQMVHHYGVYGFFSQAVQPYNEMQIFDRILTPEAMLMSRIVDPYTYLANGRFDHMPKLIINSSGDEFFVTDSAQFYWDDIPGEQNYLLYIPNTGHGLDISLGASGDPNQSKVATSTVTFVDAVINNRPLPKYSWTVEQDGAIRVVTETTPLEVRLWQAHNPAVRDFRRLAYPNITWTSTLLSPTAPGVYVGNVAAPATGARGYFVELTFANSNPSPLPLISAPYVFTTEVRVKSPLPFHPWPFASAFDTTTPLVDPAGAAVASALAATGPTPMLNATASALAMTQSAWKEETEAAALVEIAEYAAPVPAAGSNSATSTSLLEADESLGAKSAEGELSDSLLDELLFDLLA